MGGTKGDGHGDGVKKKGPDIKGMGEGGIRLDTRGRLLMMKSNKTKKERNK